MAAEAPSPGGWVYHRPWLYAKQQAAIFTPARYALIEASTKCGKTVGCMAWLFEQAAQGQPGWQYWWAAPIYPQSRIAYRRMKRGLPHGLVTANESEMTLTLANGAVLAFKSGEHPDSLYGEDVHAGVIDEASRFKEEAWHAFRSTLTATRGPVRIIGNVKGRKNWFYRMARQAEAEPTSSPATMAYAKITAYDAIEAGILRAEEIADARRLLPDAVFRELYLGEPADDQGNPFGLAAIAACLGPLSETDPVVWGWDLGKAQDWTVGVGLDAEGRVCRLERWQRSWEDTARWIVGLVGPQTPALIDWTGLGDPVLEMLHREAKRLGWSGENYEGLKFTSASKQQLMEGLAIALHRREITLPEGPLQRELEAFEYVYTRTGVRYSAPDGVHDDCVCALALAVQHRPAAVRVPFEVF